MMAHDLRNPLSALLTNVNFARGAVSTRPEDVDAALSDASLSCALLTQLIGNIDVLSAVLAELPPLRRLLRARELADQAIFRMSPLAPLADLQIEHVASPWSPMFLLDPVFVGRALDNLLANALQFAPRRSVVGVTCVAEGDCGFVEVTDEGPLIPEDLRALVLTADGQDVAKATFKARYGRGLGLYCAAEAARLAGAELVIGERDGRAVFKLSAPLAPAEHPGVTAGR